MTEIAQHITDLKAQLPMGVELVAVSKFHPAERIQAAYDAGQRVFAESRAQELVAKAPNLPNDIRWHFIGKLQTNKVRMIMPYVTMIQSIDSVRLLRLVDKEAARIGREVDVLLQLHVAQEETKSGFLPEELLAAAHVGELDGMTHTHIAGVMGMASFVDDREQIAREFEQIANVFNRLKADRFAHDDRFAQMSMGMTDDWNIAVRHGSTMVRIGSAIFGVREY